MKNTSLPITYAARISHISLNLHLSAQTQFLASIACQRARATAANDGDDREKRTITVTRHVAARNEQLIVAVEIYLTTFYHLFILPCVNIFFSSARARDEKALLHTHTLLSKHTYKITIVQSARGLIPPPSLLFDTLACM